MDYKFDFTTVPNVIHILSVTIGQNEQLRQKKIIQDKKKLLHSAKFQLQESLNCEKPCVLIYCVILL